MGLNRCPGPPACNFRGPFTGPLEPSHNRCFAGPPVFFQVGQAGAPSGQTVIRPALTISITTTSRQRRHYSAIEIVLITLHYNYYYHCNYHKSLQRFITRDKDVIYCCLCVYAVQWRRQDFVSGGAQVWRSEKTENKCMSYHPRQHCILLSMRYCTRPVCHSHTIIK